MSSGECLLTVAFFKGEDGARCYSGNAFLYYSVAAFCAVQLPELSFVSDDSCGYVGDCRGGLLSVGICWHEKVYSLIKFGRILSKSTNGENMDVGKNMKKILLSIVLILTISSLAEATDKTLSCIAGKNGTMRCAGRYASGAISFSSGSHYITVGQTVNVFATPNEGYRLSSLLLSYVNKSGSYIKQELVDENVFVPDGRYSFSMPSADASINASFAKIISSKITDGVSNEHCKVSGFPEMAEENSIVNLKVSCEDGYDLIPVVKTDDKIVAFNSTSRVPGSGSYTFTMPAASVTIFGETLYAITTNTDGMRLFVWKDDASEKISEKYAGENWYVEVLLPEEIGYKINSVSYEFMGNDGAQTENVVLSQVPCDESISGQCVTGIFNAPAAPFTIQVERSEVTWRFMTNIDSHCSVYDETNDENRTGLIQVGSQVSFYVECASGYNFVEPALNTFEMFSTGKPIELKEDKVGARAYYSFEMPNTAVILSGKMTYDISLNDEVEYEGDLLGENPIVQGSVFLVYPTANPSEAASLDKFASEKSGVLVAAVPRKNEWVYFTYTYVDADNQVQTSNPIVYDACAEKVLCQAYFEMPASPVTINVIRMPIRYPITMKSDYSGAEFYIYENDEAPVEEVRSEAAAGEVVAMQVPLVKGTELSMWYDIYEGTEKKNSVLIEFDERDAEAGFIFSQFYMPSNPVVINIVHTSIDYKVGYVENDEFCKVVNVPEIANYKDVPSFSVLCVDGYSADVSLTCGKGEVCPKLDCDGNDCEFSQPATEVTIVVKSVKQEESSSDSEGDDDQSSSSAGDEEKTSSSSKGDGVKPESGSSSSEKAESVSSSSKEDGVKPESSSSSSEKAESVSSSSKGDGVKPESSSSSSKNDDDKSSSSEEKEFVLGSAKKLFSVYAEGRKVIIDGAKYGDSVTIFSMQGQVVKSLRVGSAQQVVDLPRSGGYLVKVGSFTKRLNIQ